MPNHYIPIHQDNIAKSDWIIILESGTIVGPSTEKLRVARATLERKIVKKYNIFLRSEHFLVLEGYDPRIHVLYFCPQLYKVGSDDKLVALEGEDIGKLLAQALQGGVVRKQPWYDPSEKVLRQPVITTAMQTEFDSVVVDAPPAREQLPAPAPERSRPTAV